MIWAPLRALLSGGGHPRRRTLQMWLAAGALAVVIVGLEAMAASTEPANLQWEWPADRRPDRFLAVQLSDFHKEGGGWFGIRRSPSLANSLPDARILEGKVLNGPLTGHAVRLRAPGGELPKLARGDRAAFGMVDDKTCICVLRVPANVAAPQLDEWLAQQSCGG